MRIAIMQPYLFPYLGYYQLVQAVDQFVFFDDVNFIKKGWIHRNAITVQGKSHLFTVPLQNISQNETIKNTQIHPVEYPRWRKKFLTTLYQSYKGSPFLNEAYALVEETLLIDTESIATLAARSINTVAEYLKISTNFEDSSSLQYERSGDGQAKILSICQLKGATTYLNPIGGMNLYEPKAFEQNNIRLNFLQSKNSTSPQPTSSFVPNLSIIDALMQCSVSEIQERLTQYELVNKTSIHEPI